MGASFRNSDEILELAGCDLLTIAPSLLDELSKAEGVVTRKLNPDGSKNLSIPRIEITEKSFRWLLNENQMATEKLSEGIRKFAEDSIKLEKWVSGKMNEEGLLGIKEFSHALLHDHLLIVSCERFRPFSSLEPYMKRDEDQNKLCIALPFSAYIAHQEEIDSLNIWKGLNDIPQ